MLSQAYGTVCSTKHYLKNYSTSGKGSSCNSCTQTRRVFSFVSPSPGTEDLEVRETFMACTEDEL